MKSPDLDSYDLSSLRATIFPITTAVPNRIAIVARPRGGDWLCDEVSALARAGIDVLVSMLTVEETNELGLRQESDECAAAAMTFVNLPITDRSVPSDRDEFFRSVEQLAQMVRGGRFLAVHCRASIGRSSILAVSLLARLGWDLNQAFATVEAARGCSIPDTPEQRQWVFENIPVAH